MVANTPKQFLENLKDLTDEKPAKILQSQFDTARNEDSFDEHNKQLNEKRAAQTLEQQNYSKSANWGNLDSSQFSGTFALAAKGHAENNAKANEARNQASADTLFLALLDQIEKQIANFTDQIEKMEKSFDELYGKTWREDLAHEILNEVPAQKTNETIEEYRDRLETLLIAEMLEDGKIKDEYKNHPNERIRNMAIWARIENSKNNAEDAKNTLENGTQEEKQEIYMKYQNDINKLEEAIMTRNLLDKSSEEQEKVEMSAINSRDKIASSATLNIGSITAFLKS